MTNQRRSSLYLTNKFHRGAGVSNSGFGLLNETLNSCVRSLTIGSASHDFTDRTVVMRFSSTTTTFWPFTAATANRYCSDSATPTWKNLVAGFNKAVGLEHTEDELCHEVEEVLTRIEEK